MHITKTDYFLKTRRVIDLKKIFFLVIIILFFIPFGINYAFFIFEVHKKIESKKLIAEKKILNENKLYVLNNIEIQEQNNIKKDNQTLENYLISVVAAEMPVSFELEALKAQAVASRTYAIKNYDGINYKNLYQAYFEIEDLKKKWGDNFDENYRKIKTAVNSTAGETIKYNKQEIQAVIHAISSGFTENSENVWAKPLPYLKSVDSHEDKNAPGFLSEKKFLLADFIKKINSRYKTNLTQNNFKNNFLIAQRSKAGYIKKLNICGKNIDGMDFRFFLNLRSNNFDFKLQQNQIIFITKGFGHGAGMSQYGANFLAKKGFDYKKILKHYYQNVEIY